LVVIGTVGETHYQLKDLTVRPSLQVCDVSAYTAGFRMVGEADGDRAGKRLYREFLQRLTTP